jgi:hypothetical protein
MEKLYIYIYKEKVEISMIYCTIKKWEERIKWVSLFEVEGKPSRAWARLEVCFSSSICKQRQGLHWDEHTQTSFTRDLQFQLSNP